ncbi:DUF805 domain-containing protein [Palleronia caenipelagi]|nr:DUF805 domain-containing protein [Palleronia caenipelagi]
MSFTNAVRTCFEKYFTFSGRASRAELWWFVLFLFLASVLLTAINVSIFGPTVTENWQVAVNQQGEQTQSSFTRISYDGGWLETIFSIATLLPLVAVSVRRLHDTEKSGWRILIPVISFSLPFIVWFGFGTEVPVDPEYIADGLLPQTVVVPSSNGIFVFTILAVFAAHIAMIIWLTRPSQPGPNKYGPNPHEVTQ